MTSESNISILDSKVGVVNSGNGNVHIEGNLIIDSSSEESFDNLDIPRLSPAFKGRRDFITTIDDLFFTKKERKIVIFGLPGYGKTELAKKYAMHCLDLKKIAHAFWIEAENPNNLQKNHKFLKKAYTTFANEHCLFIFDNSTSRGSIMPYEPPDKKNFLLLVTSRYSDWGDDIKKVPIKPLSTNTALDIFKKILIHRYDHKKIMFYEKMANFVSNVPLGLIVLAGDLRFKIDASRQKPFNYDTFINLIMRKTTYTKEIHPGISDPYKWSIYTAISISLDNLQEMKCEDSKVRELTSKILCICAYLKPEFIYEADIFEIMRFKETYDFDCCMYLLENFSFIEYHKMYEKNYITIHRLCQEIIRLYFVKSKEECYTTCLNWLLQYNYENIGPDESHCDYNEHVTAILSHAEDNYTLVKNIFQNINSNYENIQTLLRLLVDNGCYKCIEIIFCNDMNDMTKKEYVENFKLLHVAARTNQIEILKFLLPYGNTYLTNEFGYIPYDIARLHNSVQVRKILFEHEIKFYEKFKNHPTSLHRSAYEGDINIVKKLINDGADVHFTDQHNWTALHEAAKGGHVDVARFLLECDCYIDAENLINNTALHLANNADVVIMLLEHGTNVNARDSFNYTALHMATISKKIDIMRVLLEYGIDVTVQESINGRTALHFAAENGHEDIVRLLLEYGSNIEVRNKENQTALQIAVVEGNVEAEHVLLNWRSS